MYGDKILPIILSLCHHIPLSLENKKLKRTFPHFHFKVIFRQVNNFKFSFLWRIYVRCIIRKFLAIFESLGDMGLAKQAFQFRIKGKHKLIKKTRRWIFHISIAVLLKVLPSWYDSLSFLFVETWLLRNFFSLCQLLIFCERKLFFISFWQALF